MQWNKALIFLTIFQTVASDAYRGHFLRPRQPMHRPLDDSHNYYSLKTNSRADKDNDFLPQENPLSKRIHYKQSKPKIQRTAAQILEEREQQLRQLQETNTSLNAKIHRFREIKNDLILSILATHAIRAQTEPFDPSIIAFLTPADEALLQTLTDTSAPNYID